MEEQRSTVKLIDVAQAAGVSPATVSRVLNGSALVTEEKRRLVLDTVKALGYVPLRPLAADREARPEAEPGPGTRQQLVVVIRGTVNGMAQNGILWTARELGYGTVILAATEDHVEDSRQMLTVLRSLKEAGLLAGVLLCSPVLGLDPELLAFLDRCPVVQIGQLLPLAHSAITTVESQQVSYEAVHYLAGCGKTHPALLVRSLSPEQSPEDQRRIWGYRLAMMEQGAELSQMLVREADGTLEGGMEAIDALLKEGHRPDGVLCSSDETAIGCLKALQSHGFAVPQQVAVLGMEDGGVGLFASPQLSTIAAPQAEAGENAMRLLHRLIQGAVEPNYRAVLPHELIVRGSSEAQDGTSVHNWRTGQWVEGRRTF